MPDIINIHSEEVQEIMGRKPSWIMRWGITVLITIIVVFIVCCYFIRYPQTVAARITLTSDYPPADLVAKATGIIDSVFVSDGDKICKGQLLALIASAADYGDMVTAEKYVSGDEPYAEFTEDELKRLQSLKLGDIQPNWIEYLSACS
ncbi:MAG: hypothetical protein II542_05135, partial [Bacteroidales bacterium]|nr:hypothetical protein [Bacteroidales bacterium]